MSSRQCDVFYHVLKEFTAFCVLTAKSSSVKGNMDSKKVPGWGGKKGLSWSNLHQSPRVWATGTDFTTLQTTAGGHHKPPCSCAERLSAHYAVGCCVLQAPCCLTWWSYETVASQQVGEVWSNTSLKRQHLSELLQSVPERSLSKPKIAA